MVCTVIICLLYRLAQNPEVFVKPFCSTYEMVNIICFYLIFLLNLRTNNAWLMLKFRRKYKIMRCISVTHYHYQIHVTGHF